MSRQRSLGVMIALGAFVVLSAVALLSGCEGPYWAGAGGIESDLTAKTLDRLDDLGVAGEVTVDGRDVSLSVTEELPAGLSTADLGGDLLAVDGVRTVDVMMDLPPAPPPTPTPEPAPEPTPTPELPPEPIIVEAEINGDQVDINAKVQSEAQVDELRTAAQAAFGGFTVGNVLTGPPDGTPEVDSLIFGFGDALVVAGQRFQTGQLRLEDGRLFVTGTLADQDTIDLARDQIEGLADAYGFEPVFDLQVGGPDVETVIGDIDLTGVTFESGTAALTIEATAVLDIVAATLSELDAVNLEVQGHTDSTGDPDANLLLSQLRAEAVVDYLVTQGIDPATLTAQGYGASAPIADNATADGQAANRRVELVVVEGN